MGGIGDCYWFSVAPSFPLVSTDTKLVWHYFILLHTHSCVHGLSSAMDVNDMLDDLQVRNLRNNRRRRGPPVINRRVDPTENLSDETHQPRVPAPLFPLGPSATGRPPGVGPGLAGAAGAPAGGLYRE